MYSSDDRKVMQNSDKNPIVPQHPRLREYKWWFRVSLYIIFLLTGQSSALLLERLYYDKGGNSKWMVAFVQSAGFPLLLPLMIYSSNAKFTNNMLIINDDSSKTKPKVPTLVSLYLVFGLILAGDNFMYSYGILYLPLSTFCLLCATELAFNALFAFFLNSQKFTPLIFNSIVLLTIPASLLAINSDSDDESLMVNLPAPRETIVLGFFFTLGACSIFSLYLCLVQLCFERVIKSETFSAVLDMQFYPCIIATCACVVGLFASGEWKTLDEDMKGYENGKVSYIMTLLWIAVMWQICYIGMLGLVFDVSSLFSNVIGTLVTSIVPILAVVFFRDNINGVKFIALVLAVWGFLSYIYQHYLNDKKAKEDKSLSLEVSKGGEAQVC